MICELLGVPYADRDEFQRRTARQLDLSLPWRSASPLQQESRAYMAGLVARAKADPGEDMLGMLVREHGDDLSDDELAGIASLLLIAGHETTSNMLGLGTLALLRHPDQLALVRDDPRLSDAAVEELMRWLSIVHTGVARTTTTDVEIARARRSRRASWCCARCPRRTATRRSSTDPDDGSTSPAARSGHLAFGHGVHHCLGAPLARMEMRVAFPALLRRFPALALDVPFDEIPFRSFHFIYGLHSLPVTW